ncbi:MAG: DUF2330 domain-containing protein [Lentisphaeraceae bacterium]|nr:DUF2330 domain-containing protein [Lentisphaeraceae bacterium]
MLPHSFDGEISQRSQQALIVYDNGVEDLVLKISPSILSENKLPTFCWLITVPNEPEHYDVVNKSFFSELEKLKKEHLVKPEPIFNIACSKHSEMDKILSAAESAPKGVELGKRVNVEGIYDIQPVRGVGEHALTGLNTWLKQNGFPVEPLEHMKYFVDKKFTFLCIKVNPASGESGIQSSPQLKPLHIRFKSDKVYYPMKYSSQQGDFSANIYTLTTKPIDYKQSRKTMRRLTAYADYRLYKNVDLSDSSDLAPLEKVLGDRDFDHLYFNNMFCASPNYDKAISKWQEDVFFELNDSHKPNDANLIKKSSSIPGVIFMLVIGFLAFKAVKKRLTQSST